MTEPTSRRPRPACVPGVDRAGQTLQRATDDLDVALRRRFHVNHFELVVLQQLAREPAPVRLTDLRAMLGSSHQRLGLAVARLADRHLVDVPEPTAADQSHKRVAITPTGLDLLEHAEPVYRQHVQAVLDELSPAADA